MSKGSALMGVGKALVRSVRDLIDHDLVVRAPRPRVKPKIGYDNPGGGWLKVQRERAAQNATAHHPVTGAVTAYTRKPIELDPRKIRHLPGARGERRVKGEHQYDRLLESVKRDGGLHEDAPILIGVNHEGKPYIIEGNTRTAVADDLGIRAVPAEVRYFAGGEERADDWAPGQLEKYMAPSELVSSPRFQRWFGAGTLVDKYGEPLPVYHGTGNNFRAFRHRDDDIGIHFGTIGQAEDRLALRNPGNENIISAYLNLENPLRVDDIGSFDLDNMKDQIGGRNIHDIGDLRESLFDRGYDGLVYRNTGETAGGAKYRAAADEALDRWRELYRKYAPTDGHSYYQISPAMRDEHPDLAEALDDYSLKSKEYEDFRNANSEDSYIVLDPTQIKSRFNRGTFNPFDPDISKAEGGLIR